MTSLLISSDAIHGNSRTRYPGIINSIDAVANAKALSIGGGWYISGLQYGHRSSIDLATFTGQPFPEQEIADELITIVPAAVKTDQPKNTLSFFINGVEVDLLAHRYPPFKCFHYKICRSILVG